MPLPSLPVSDGYSLQPAVRGAVAPTVLAATYQSFFTPPPLHALNPIFYNHRRPLSQVREAAAQLQLDAPEPGRVAVVCCFIAHVLGLLRQADRLYNSAVQASMQLALEIQDDLVVMMQLAVTCSDRRQVWELSGEGWDGDDIGIGRWGASGGGRYR